MGERDTKELGNVLGELAYKDGRDGRQVRDEIIEQLPEERRRRVLGAALEAELEAGRKPQSSITPEASNDVDAIAIKEIRHSITSEEVEENKDNLGRLPFQQKPMVAGGVARIYDKKAKIPPLPEMPNIKDRQGPPEKLNHVQVLERPAQPKHIRVEWPVNPVAKNEDETRAYAFIQEMGKQTGLVSVFYKGRQQKFPLAAMTPEFALELYRAMSEGKSPNERDEMWRNKGATESDIVPEWLQSARGAVNQLRGEPNTPPPRKPSVAQRVKRFFGLK